MSNRLEQEFPEVAWQALPPVGPGGVPPEVMRQCLERGRQLRSRALRNSARASGAAATGGLVSLAAFLRSAAPLLWSGGGPHAAGWAHGAPEHRDIPILPRPVTSAGESGAA